MKTRVIVIDRERDRDRERKREIESERYNIHIIIIIEFLVKQSLQCSLVIFLFSVDDNLAIKLLDEYKCLRCISQSLECTNHVVLKQLRIQYSNDNSVMAFHHNLIHLNSLTTTKCHAKS